MVFTCYLPMPERGSQIVTWSVRDETLHCNSMIRIFKEFINENPEIWTPKLKKELYEACRTIIEHEDAFIDLAFEMGPMEGLTAQEVKRGCVLPRWLRQEMVMVMLSLSVML